MKKIKNLLLLGLTSALLTGALAFSAIASHFATNAPTVVYAWGDTEENDDDVVTIGQDDDDDDTPTDIGDDSGDSDVDLENGEGYTETEEPEDDGIDIVYGDNDYTGSSQYYYIDEVCVQEHGYLDEECIKFDENAWTEDFLDFIENHDWTQDFERMSSFWETFGEQIMRILRKAGEQWSNFFGN